MQEAARASEKIVRRYYVARHGLLTTLEAAGSQRSNGAVGGLFLAGTVEAPKEYSLYIIL